MKSLIASSFLIWILTIASSYVLAVNGMNGYYCNNCTTAIDNPRVPDQGHAFGGPSHEFINVSRVLRHLLQNYDKLIRPGLGGSACKIKVNLFFVSFAPINEPDMEYTPTFYFRQYWDDPRLAYGDALVAKSVRPRGDFTSNIWIPDTFFEDDLTDNVRRLDEMLEMSSKGNVKYSSRWRIRAYCPMAFTRFPFDVQRCSLTFSSFSYDDRDVIYKWMDDHPALEFSPELRMSHYDLIEWSTEEKLEVFATGKYATLTAKFLFKRRVRFYILQAFIPAGLITSLSWVGFWIDERSVPARVSLGITTVLAITTLIFGVQATLPRVGYIKAIDVYLLGNFLFVFASLVEYAVICSMSKEDERKLRQEEVTESRKAVAKKHWWDKEGRPVEKLEAKEENVEVSQPVTPDDSHKQTPTPPGPKVVEPPLQSYWFEVGNLYLRRHKKRHSVVPRYFQGSIYHITDRISRIAFPLAYFLFLIFYFIGFIYL